MITLEEFWEKGLGRMLDADTNELIDSNVVMRNPKAEVESFDVDYNGNIHVKYEKEPEETNESIWENRNYKKMMKFVDGLLEGR